MKGKRQDGCTWEGNVRKSGRRGKGKAEIFFSRIAHGIKIDTTRTCAIFCLQLQSFFFLFLLVNLVVKRVRMIFGH